MSLFVDSLALQRAPGAYAIEVAPPIVIEGVVNGYVGYVFRGEWGPDNEVTEPGGTAEFNQTYFPPGSPHTSTGYYALMGRKAMPLRPCRILKNGVKAVTTATAGAGTYTATAKYKGVLGSSISLTWRAATNGVGANRDLDVVLTHPVTGTTQERIRNIVVVASGEVDVGESLLLDSLTFNPTADDLPAVDATTLLGVTTAGSDGDPITATEYTAALALLALRRDLLVTTIDDCGNSIRNAVNDALVAHAGATRSRQVTYQGCNPSETWASVKTYVGTHSPSVRSDRSFPQGAWVQTLDDEGNPQTTPWATYLASAIANLEPQQSPSWWDDRVTQLYASVAGIVAPFSTADTDVQGEATDLGIGLPIRLDSGAYAGLHDRTSSLTSGKRFGITRRIKDFLARSMLSGIRSFVNGTNWRGRQLDIQGIINTFLGSQDPTVRPDDPRLIAWSTSITSGNTAQSIALGQFVVAIDGQSPSVMEKIGLLMNVGETVTVRETT